MTTLPPIAQEVRDALSRVAVAARIFAEHLSALADDLADNGAQEPQDYAFCAPAPEPDDGLTAFEVRLRGTHHEQPRTERVRAMRYGTDSDGCWVTFYAPGVSAAAMYAAEAVESVRVAG